MRFLCLHGRGTSADIFKKQTAAFRAMLSEDYTFDFIDGPYPSTPAAGVDIFFPPPYYSFWHGTAIDDIRASHRFLQDHLDQNGPYDGVLLFSQGCALVASFLLYRQVENPHLPPPFQIAIFICGGVPLEVAQDLGVHVPQAVWDKDERSKHELIERASSVASVRPGTDYWVANSDGSVSVKASDIDKGYGLEIPLEIQINIATVHIYGSKDPRCAASLQLVEFCRGLRKTFDHGGGHDVPRTTYVSNSIAELVRWTASVSEKI